VLNQRLPRGLSGAHVLVIGTGGSARAAIAGARNGKAAQITVAGRDKSKSAALSRELECATCALDAIGSIAWDALVHCTPLGSRAAPNELAIDARALRRGAVVLDAVYRPARTPLIEAAERAGAIPVSGAEWFAEQAIAQFKLLTHRGGHESALRAELARALEEDLAR
jgi:shikimate dehydrogenase